MSESAPQAASDQGWPAGASGKLKAEAGRRDHAAGTHDDAEADSQRTWWRRPPRWTRSRSPPTTAQRTEHNKHRHGIRLESESEVARGRRCEPEERKQHEGGRIRRSQSRTLVQMIWNCWCVAACACAYAVLNSALASRCETRSTTAHERAQRVRGEL